VWKEEKKNNHDVKPKKKRKERNRN
jgi:hypothetical protein